MYYLSLYRYVAVGAIATASHYLVLVALVEGLAINASAASFIGACAGAAVAFSGQRSFTFADRPRTTLALPRFLAVAGRGALLNSVIVWTASATGLHYLMAQAIATVIIVCLTYHLNDRWSFA